MTNDEIKKLKLGDRVWTTRGCCDDWMEKPGTVTKVYKVDGNWRCNIQLDEFISLGVCDNISHITDEQEQEIKRENLSS